MIKAVIFDMDGVLLDSEPFWHEAEMEIFATVGIQLTRKQCIEMAGLPTKDIVDLLFKRNPWHTKSKEKVIEEIIKYVKNSIIKRGVPMEGLKEILDFFQSRNIKLALATSSPYELIEAVIEKLNLHNVFSTIHSAEDEKYAKPHPAVFLTTAEKMKIEPTDCLVIEDSFYGLISAKSARMKTLVIPQPEQREDMRFCIADLKLNSLKEFNEKHWEFLNSI